MSLLSISASVGSGFSQRHTVRGTYSMPLPLTPKQRDVLSRIVDGKVTVCGRTFTRPELMSIFAGHQLPRDPAVCEALDIRH